MTDYEPRENQDAEQAAQPQPAEGDETPLSEQTEQTEMEFVPEASGNSRSTAMVVLTLLLVGAGAIGFMRFKSAPKAAAAAAPETKNASATINAFLSDGGKDVKLMQELLKNTEKLRKLFLSYPLRKQIKVEDLATNPFRSKFPRGGQAHHLKATAEGFVPAEKEIAFMTAGSVELALEPVAAPTTAVTPPPSNTKKPQPPPTVQKPGDGDLRF